MSIYLYSIRLFVFDGVLFYLCMFSFVYILMQISLILLYANFTKNVYVYLWKGVCIHVHDFICITDKLTEKQGQPTVTLPHITFSIHLTDRQADRQYTTYWYWFNRKQKLESLWNFQMSKTQTLPPYLVKNISLLSQKNPTNKHTLSQTDRQTNKDTPLQASIANTNWELYTLERR